MSFNIISDFFTEQFTDPFYLLVLIIVFITLVVLIVAFILPCSKSDMTCPNCDFSLKGAYLNHASTAATKHGTLNPSDIGYSQNYNLRSDIESLKNDYRRLVNAPINSKVIFNSGATESIANCVFWAQSYNKFGTVVGTKYDHSAVAANCSTFGLKYNPEMTEKAIMNNCSMIVLTQVDSKTGELLNIDNFHRNFMRFSFMNDNMNPLSGNQFHPFNDKYTLQYRPLLVLDAAQSIGKVPIYMERWGINAVFFSLHKIGGPIGLGVLIVNDSVQFPFKPLISGSQQMNLRGGTLPMQLFVDANWVLESTDDANVRVDKWESVMKKLKGSKLNVYEPKNKHLYNTFLIAVNGCPLKVIARLAKEGIYIGNVSACKNEEILNSSINNNETEDEFVEKIGNVEIKGGDLELDAEIGNGVGKDPFKNAVRISFKDPEEINDEIVDKIINACKESGTDKEPYKNDE